MTQPTPTPPADDLLAKSLEAAAEIQQSADELSVVHAVLQTELADAEPSADAQNAVEHTKDIKDRLENVAHDLERAAKAAQS